MQLKNEQWVASLKVHAAGRIAVLLSVFVPHGQSIRDDQAAALMSGRPELLGRWLSKPKSSGEAHSYMDR